MQLESIMLSKVIQKEQKRYRMISGICGIQKNKRAKMIKNEIWIIELSLPKQRGKDRKEEDTCYSNRLMKHYY